MAKSKKSGVQAEPIIEETNTRLIKRGDVVVVKGTDRTEVVRSVSTVLHMADGQDLVYTTEESVEKVTNPDPSYDEAVAEILAEGDTPSA